MVTISTESIFKRLYLVIAIVSQAFADSDEIVRVKISQGIMEGRIKYTTENLAFRRDSIKYYSFEGIPYAHPPTGNLRFKNPIYFDNWRGVYDATKLKSKCSQVIDVFDRYEGHEDCLFVNVYTRNLKKNHSNPVVVVLHGGRFRTGAGHLNDPLDFLLEIDSVVVTFNYRLHILGLLSLNNENAPGNVQNKDQVLALKWVKNNIKHLGGDPNNVALYGISSGASSAYLLHTSPMARGLFHKSILVSGAFLCNWYTGYEPVALVNDFGKFLGLPTNNTEDIYRYLMKIPEKELIEKTFDFEFKNGLQLHKFSLTFENSTEDVETFMSRSPLSAYKTGTFNDLPMMISYSSLEFTSYLRDQLFENYTKNYDLLLPSNWKIPIGSKLYNDIINKILIFYFNTTNIQTDNYEHILSFTLLMSDVKFFQPINEVIRTHAEYAKGPLYVYRFSYRGGLNNENIEKYQFQGAAHCDDKTYIFRKDTVDLYSSDNIVRQRLLILYRNFLMTSNPTPGPLTHKIPFEWPPYTKERRDYLSMSGESVISQDPDARRFKFWKELEDFVLEEGQFNRNWKDTCSFG